MPAFSIVVPVYNAEKTLYKCLESLMCQSYADFEVIMVENGSSDASAQICAEYAKKDSRFILFQAESNCGPSGARNIGLDGASGSYVAFVDSDDYVEPDYLKALHQEFEKNDADAVFFGYRQLLTDGTFVCERIPQAGTDADRYQTLIELSKQDMFGYTWIKAFKRDTIGEHRFSRELNLMEDEVFTSEVLSSQCRVSVLPEAIYNYITGNVGSLMGRTHQDYCKKVDAAFHAFAVLLENCPQKDAVLKERANASVSKCMYYGFERDVDPTAFFKSLADSEFFKYADNESEFSQCVKNGELSRLGRMRAAYRFKTRLAKILKK